LLLTVADHSARIRGFYAVLDRDDPGLADLLLAGGACALQVRMKPASAAAVLAAARRVRDLTRRLGVLLVVNDRVDLALAAGADAVHLGQDDLPLAVARQLAPGLLIGISTHDETQVRAAVAGGADYLGFGPVFATTTKLNPDPVQGIRGLARAVELAGRVPVVGIGGITPANAAEVAATGAAAACAIASVNGAPDVTVAARTLGKPWTP
jgi:thiamine-phosphate pyrophosphorylase